jgi:diguanylate cyclase (GGDEF)-like protein
VTDGAPEPDPPEAGIGSGRSRAVRVWALTLAIAIAAVALFMSVLGDGWAPPVDGGNAVLLAGVLLLAFVVAELAVVYIPIGRNAYSLSLNEIPTVVGLFLLSPVVLVVVRVLGALLVLGPRNRRSPRKLGFNLAMYGMESVAVLAMWHAVLGGADPLSPRGWLAVCAALVLADLLTTLLIGAVIGADTGQRPRLWSDLYKPGPVAPLVNASFALVLVYVVTVDWRALWTVAVVMAVLFFAHRAYHVLRRRTESLEQLSRFTGEIGSQLDVDSAARAAVTWIAQVLHAETAELTLTADFAGRPRRWVSGFDGSSTEVDGTQPVATALQPWLADGAVLVRRGTRDRALGRALATAGLRDAVAMPLQGDDGVIGTLLVGDRLGDVETFAAADLRELQALGNHLSVTLRNARRADRIAEDAAAALRRSLHDELTGLPNRRHLESRLAELLAEQGSASVALLDLDRFAEVNDALGHDAGDDLLREVADRLTRMAEPGWLVARVGTDEFAVLLPGADDGQVGSAAVLLRHAFARPFEMGELLLTIEASVGVAMAGDGSASDVVRRADVAMNAAKARRTGLETYRAELDTGSAHRLTVLSELKSAITDGALAVHFQPKVRLRDGVVVAAEALVRWQHPTRGMVPPDEFVPVAEHSGLITPLTLTVLRQALEWCERVRRSGHDLGVSVNVSPRNLLDPSFVDEVARAVAAVEVPAAALTLEITESSLMADPERAVAALERLQSLGVRLSIDDLGTGYSSLAYLQRLPVGEIKIDKSFLAPGAADGSLAIVAAVVELGQRLGRDVVAEGVEDEATWRTLQQLGCDVAQGYWISRPLPGEQLAEWLAAWRPTAVAGLHAVTG